MDQKIFDFDGTFFRGMKSDSDPGQLSLGYYWSGMNVVNVGGLISCRPGYRCIVKFPQGKLQGAALFQPKVGVEQLVVGIDGVIYVSPFPFISYRILDNVLMSPTAKQLYFQMTTQAAERKTTDFGSAIEVIDPRAVLFIQDGGATAPAWFDGSSSGHVRNNLFETPAGGPMAWVGDRLWVANRNRVFASDIANPFSFREQTYLGGNDAFYFSGEVTAMAHTPSLEFPQLVVFTDSNASIVQANVRERAKWPLTDGMQVEVFQVGATSQRSIVLYHGELAWFSSSGVVFFDSAKVSQISAHLPISDNEMQVSKARLSPDLSLVAGAAFGNYLLMSVPTEDLYNKHTWVHNGAALESLDTPAAQSWAGYWMGTRPVQWIYGVIAGRERIYHISADEDGENRLWEAFTDERLDNGCPITWFIETRGHFGQTSQAKKLPGSNVRYGFSDIALCGIEEDLDLAVFYAGGTRGAYKNVLAKKISVERGSIRHDVELDATTSVFAFKPQSRFPVRTQDANQQPTEDDTGSCPIESPAIENLDESIQLLIVGQGPATIRWIRSFAFDTPEDRSGDPAACEDETQFNAIRFDGVGVKTEEIDPEELAQKTMRHYTSVQTVTLSDDNVTAVGSGTAESVISQGAADRVAAIIATRAAESELRQALPGTLSVGQGFVE